MARALERHAETDGLIADRATVGNWVKRVRRSLEGGEHFALSELGTIINPTQPSEPPAEKQSTAPPPGDGEDEVQSLAAKLGLGITGAILLLGALIWFLLSPSSFKAVFSTERESDTSTVPSADSAGLRPLVAPQSPTGESQLPTGESQATQQLTPLPTSSATAPGSSLQPSAAPSARAAPKVTPPRPVNRAPVPAPAPAPKERGF